MGPILCGSSIEAWCVRKSSYVRGRPPKTRVAGKGETPSSPVPRVERGGQPTQANAWDEIGRGGVIACAYYVEAKVVRVRQSG